MALIDKLFNRKKTLSQLDKQELRKEEILLTKQRDRLFKKIETIGAQKQQIFKQGASQKSPELRKALAQDFELKTQEQLMSARELNLRSKELLTVSRLRMVRENNERGRATGRLNLTDKDVAKISGLIEDDNVSQDVYRDRLDALLEIGAQGDKDALASAGLSSAGQELMNIWDELDRGAVKQEQAFDQADQAVRGALRRPMGKCNQMNTAYIDKTAERELLPTEPASTSLNYASPGMRFTPPFDFAGAFRQAIFAIGIGLLVFGETVAWGNSRAWSDDMGAWAGVGAGLIALTIPWPGHLGRKRDER